MGKEEKKIKSQGKMRTSSTPSLDSSSRRDPWAETPLPWICAFSTCQTLTPELQIH